MLAFLDPLVLVLHAVLLPLTHVMPPALAVVALTLGIRLALHPLVRMAFRASRDGKVGCLPILLQIPIVSAVYRLFTATTIGGHANALLGQQLFGVSLGQHLLASAGPDMLVFVVVMAAVAGVAWGSFRFARRTAPAPVLPDGASPEVAEAMARTARLLPALSFGSVLAVVFLPLAAGIYLFASTAWALAERTWLHSRYPAAVVAVTA